jgi:hypothetical protein
MIERLPPPEGDRVTDVAQALAWLLRQLTAAGLS